MRPCSRPRGYGEDPAGPRQGGRAGRRLRQREPHVRRARNRPPRRGAGGLARRRARFGNHTWSHPDLERTRWRRTWRTWTGAAPVDSLLELRGRRLVWFRHPFLHAGDTPEKKAGLAAHLAENGWKVAPVTVDNQEWVYASSTTRRSRAETRRWRRELQRRTSTTSTTRSRTSRRARGRSWGGSAAGAPAPCQSTERGPDGAASDPDPRARIRFVELAEAMEDGVRAGGRHTGRGGPSWIERWAIAAGASLRGPREHPWVAETYQRYRISR